MKCYQHIVMFYFVSFLCCFSPPKVAGHKLYSFMFMYFLTSEMQIRCQNKHRFCRLEQQRRSHTSLSRLLQHNVAQKTKPKEKQIRLRSQDTADSIFRLHHQNKDLRNHQSINSSNPPEAKGQIWSKSQIHTRLLHGK